MNKLNGYWLRKKENEELSTSARLYRNSMRPEELLDEMYEVMQNVGLGEEFDPDDLSTLFSDFSNDEKMYPSMMKPERRKLWDQRKRQLEQIQERQKNAKRQLHAQLMMRNPELPLTKELRKTEYGQGLMAEMTTNRPRKPETGTGRTIIDEQERDSVNMGPIQQFETKPFTAPDMDEPFSLLATERDKNGRIIKKALALAPQPILREYEYDNNGRLSKVLCEGSVIEKYHYGKYGERLISETRHSKQSLYKYNDRLQVIEAGDTKYYYDNRGRIIEKINLGRRTHYSYLESGPLHEVILPDGRRIEYTCDAAGRRITKSINGKVVEKYLWQDLTTLIAITDGEGLHPRVFIYEDEGGPVAMTYEGATFIFATDQVDSIFMVADEQGNEVKRIIYDSFGNLLFDSNEKFDTYIGFATGLTDKDTGLIHFGQREYDPASGRFITPDPIGFAGGDVDVYGYCLDDPINFYDRTGLFAFVPVIGGAIGAGYNLYDNYKDWKSGKMSTLKYMESIGLGAATGMASTLGGGLATSVIMGAGSAAANEAGNQYIKTGKVGDKEKVIKAGVSGSVGSVVGRTGQKIGKNIVIIPKSNKIPAKPLGHYGNLGSVIGASMGSEGSDKVIKKNESNKKSKSNKK